MSEPVDDTSSSPMVILENVSYLMSKSEYDKVIFHDVADSYATDNDIECRYTLTLSVTPSEGDKIALFKVGWDSPNSFLTYVMAKIPETNEHSSELSVIFKAEALPKDDEVFYQFCYVCADGIVKGASTPFQFRHPATEELIEIEDTESDLLIIRTRTAVFEERLREVAFKNNELAKAKASLERMILEKNEKCEEFAQKLKECRNQYEILEKDTAKATRNYYENLEKLQTDLQREKCTALEKAALHTTQMIQNDAYIEELRSTVKLLSEDKGHSEAKVANERKEKLKLQRNLALAEENLQKLSERNEQLKYELERTILLTEEQNHKRLVQESESQRKEKELKEKLSILENENQRKDKELKEIFSVQENENYMKELELKEKLLIQENENQRKQKEFKEIISIQESENRRKEKELKEKLLVQEMESHRKENELKEKLSMAERNLLLTEENLQKLTERNEQLLKELDKTIKLTRQQSHSLITQENETQRKDKELKAKIVAIEKEKKRLMNQLIDTEHMLAAMEKSKHLATDELMKHADYKKKVTADLEQAQNQILNLKKQVKSLEAEKKQQLMEKHQLEKELGEMKAKNSSLPAGTDLMEEKKNWEAEKENYTLLVTNLRERLKAGAAEYQTKYIECAKLDRKLGKLKKKLKDKNNDSKADSSEEIITSVSSSSDDKKKSEQRESKNDSSIERLLTEKDLRIKLLEEKIEILSKPTLQSTIPSQHPQVQNINSSAESAAQCPLSTRSQMYSFPNNLFPGNPYIYQPTYHPTPFFKREDFIEVDDNDSDKHPQVQNINSSAKSAAQCPQMYSTFANNLFPGNPYIYQPTYQPSQFFKREDYSEVDDNDSDEDNVHQTVLPPPIQPEVTPIAKLAAVRAVSRHVIDQESQEPSQMQNTVLPESSSPTVECDSPENDFCLPDMDNSSHDYESSNNFLQCPICEAFFEEYSDLHSHMENVHFGLECPVCNKLFQAQEQDNFEFHVQTHFVNENPYEILVD